MLLPRESLFRAYDIRGRVDEELDADNCYVIGQAIGSEAIARGLDRIAVGRDGRLSSPALMEAVVNGLVSTGVTVMDVGCVPTPSLYYVAITRCDGSGVMVTGSHNPPQYNGIKIMLGGETLYGVAIQALLQRIRQQNFAQGMGKAEAQDVIDEYIDRLVRKGTLSRALKVVVDCGNGMAGPVMPSLLRQLGCDVTELYCDVDGRFPHHHPDPNQPENLQQLRETVLASKADIGLAFDGDADRLGVISCRGEIIWPDRLMMLYSRDLLTRHPGAEVIFDIKCSRNLGQAIEQAGGRAQMWRTGHSLLKARMQESGALLAGEMSGHLFLKEGWYGFDDAFYAALKLLELVAADGRGSAAIFDDLPDMCNTPELHMDMPDIDAHDFVAQLMEHREVFGNARLTTIDGLRVDYDDGWGLVRASNTTPTLVLRFEAENETALRRIETVFRTLLLQLKPDLELPF